MTLPRSPWLTPGINEVFGLPETDGRMPYAMVARLLTETEPGALAVPGSSQLVWPAVSQGVENDAAWQEAIDAGVVTEEQAAADRAEGTYTGWRLQISFGGEMPGARWGAFYEGSD
ncbi:hypothetical protein AB1046_18315 [Promicromonospora sp. Populi]|uniref:hypothetical protein n=1 Tax=Promicromonospora sp. Populi TaxID=3239420 RepID=UPI0034E2BF0B